MQDIFLIGGSPSSGSTLLVKLLNQQENVAGLPETGLFVHGQNLLDVSDESLGNDLHWRLPWMLTGVKVANALGWGKDEYDEHIGLYPTAFELLRSRVDPTRKYWLIEKTPENIFAFDKYLKESNSNRVIVTSRDAISVVQSLMRRGFTLLEGILIWFSHSYETTQLIANYPSQVYHCAYDRLTRNPEIVISEIIKFLGITDAPPASSAYLENKSIVPDSSQLDENDDRANSISIQMYLEISSWGLTDTSWSRSPDSVVQHTEPVNLIGLDYDLLMDKIVFKTPSETLVRPSEVETGLNGSYQKLKSYGDLRCEPVMAHFESAYTQCLVGYYSPCYLLS